VQLDEQVPGNGLCCSRTSVLPSLAREIMNCLMGSPNVLNMWLNTLNICIDN
jgi:hypothetical protein